MVCSQLLLSQAALSNLVLSRCLCFLLLETTWLGCLGWSRQDCSRSQLHGQQLVPTVPGGTGTLGDILKMFMVGHGVYPWFLLSLSSSTMPQAGPSLHPSWSLNKSGSRAWSPAPTAPIKLEWRVACPQPGEMLNVCWGPAGSPGSCVGWGQARSYAPTLQEMDALCFLHLTALVMRTPVSKAPVCRQHPVLGNGMSHTGWSGFGFGAALCCSFHDGVEHLKSCVQPSAEQNTMKVSCVAPSSLSLGTPFLEPCPNTVPGCS